MLLRTVRTGFLLLAGLIAAGVPAAEESPKPSLETLATGDVDSRACDRNWNQPIPFWVAESETDQTD